MHGPADKLHKDTGTTGFCIFARHEYYKNLARRNNAKVLMQSNLGASTLYLVGFL